MRKLVALVLVLTLALTMVGGVANAETQETVTLKFFSSGGILPSNILDNPIMEQIEEKTGVILDWSPFMGGDNASEAAARAIAANDYPDIWLLNDASVITKLLEYDLVLSLDDLLANAPSLQEIATEAMNYARYRFGTEENYLVPIQIGGVNWYPSGYDNIISYRYDLWEEAGRPELNTYEDFIEFLKKCQELEPVNKDGLTNYGTGLPLGESYAYAYLDYTMLNNKGKGYYGPMVIDYESGELTPRYTEDSEFFEGAWFYYTLNQLGLLDPETATMTGDQATSKGSSFRYYFGVANWQIGWPNDYAAKEQIEIAKKDEADLTDWDKRIAKMGWVPLVIGDGGDWVSARTGTPYGNGSYYLISKTCQDPEAAMRLIDYLASWEGAELCSNGPEGYNWEWRDGKPHWYTADEREAMTAADGRVFLDNKALGISYVAPNLMVNGYRQNPNGWATIYAQEDATQYKSTMSAGEIAFTEEHGYTYGMQYVDDNYPNNVVSADVLNLIPAIENTSDLAVVTSDVETLAYEYAVRLIYARDDADFAAIKEEFQAELEAVGYADLVEYYITNYETAKATAAEWGFN